MDIRPDHKVEIQVLDEIDSTNDYLKNHSELWSKNFLTVAARSQTHGRGRSSHSWQMQSDKDLAFTMVFRYSGRPTESIGLTPFVGFAIQKILAAWVKQLLSLKWPNDILFEGKKICGILCEQVETHPEIVILIGVGVNVNSQRGENNSGATSLSDMAGHEFSLDSLRVSMIHALADELLQFQVPFSAEFCEAWYASCAHRNARVAWCMDAPRSVGTQTSKDRASQFDSMHRIEGAITGIDAYGRLLVQDDSKQMHHLTQDLEWLTSNGHHD